MSTNLTETLLLGLTLKLILSLNEFGLDPADWNIVVRPRVNTLLLTHRNDPSFRLEGKIEGGRWKTLELLSV